MWALRALAEEKLGNSILYLVGYLLKDPIKNMYVHCELFAWWFMWFFVIFVIYGDSWELHRGFLRFCFAGTVSRVPVVCFLFLLCWWDHHLLCCVLDWFLLMLVGGSWFFALSSVPARAVMRIGCFLAGFLWHGEFFCTLGTIVPRNLMGHCCILYIFQILRGVVAVRGRKFSS